MGDLSYDNFYPRSPCGERRRGGDSCYLDNIISIHALLAESDNLRVVDCSKSSIISIHALLAESDYRNWRKQSSHHKISIHALLAESDRYSLRHSTPSGHFYPRSPCGERPPKIFRHCTTYLFLSTLSLRRATARNTSIAGRITSFLSTLSLRRATVGVAQGAIAGDISIHALLAESDLD